MTGTYWHSLDTAGRLIVPAKLRDKLGKNFYMAPGGTDDVGAVDLYPLAAWEELRQKVAGLPQGDQDEFDLFFSMAQECEADKQWRFQVSDDLKAYAGLDRDVAFVGNNRTAVIWNAENWKKRSEDKKKPADFRALKAKFRV